MSNIEQKKTSNKAEELLKLSDHIEYLEGKLEHYRVQLAEAYYKLAVLQSKGKTLWGDGNGY